MLTWRIIHFKEAQEKLQNELPFAKNILCFVHVGAEDPHVTIFPLTLAHEQLLYAPHCHQ